MDHFSMELRVDSLTRDSRAAVILGRASHFTVKWLGTDQPLLPSVHPSVIQIRRAIKKGEMKTI